MNEPKDRTEPGYVAFNRASAEEARRKFPPESTGDLDLDRLEQAQSILTDVRYSLEHRGLPVEANDLDELQEHISDVQQAIEAENERSEKA